MFETDDAASEYTKFTKDSELYHVKYHYTDQFRGDEKYCDCCGEIYSEEYSVCPYCEGKNDDVLDYKSIGTMIYSSIKDGTKVIIYLWDGEVIKIN